MTCEDVRRTLGAGWFADKLDDRCREQIAAISRVVEFPPDHLIFRQGEPGSTVYVVVEGAVSLEVKSPTGFRQTLTVGEGELLGWIPVLRAGDRIASARTLRPTRVVEIHMAQLFPLFETDARLAYDFMRATVFAVAQRLEATRLQLLDLYSSPLQSSPPM
jgi:CRP/FNR family cyclic AMP-dependent transcriptional regulator